LNAVNWIKSYLCGRKQRVSFNGKISSWSNISAGVPQGSTLGPLLFTIYTLDLSHKLKYCNFHQYADDTVIYCSCSVEMYNQAINQLTSDLNAIHSWAESNYLKLNIQKCKFQVFGTPSLLKKIRNINNYPKIDGLPLERVKTVRILGMYFDECLTWSSHIAEKCKAAYRSLYQLKRLQNLLPAKLKTILTNSLVLSQLDYCDVVYDSIGPGLSHRVQLIQNACIRFIFNLKKFDHISKFMEKLNWLNMSNRRLLHKMTFTHKILTLKTPTYLSDNFIPRNTIHDHNTRQNSLIVTQQHTTSVYGSSFIVSSTIKYNALPPHLKSLNLKQFKKQYHKILLQNQTSI